MRHYRHDQDIFHQEVYQQFLTYDNCGYYVAMSLTYKSTQAKRLTEDQVIQCCVFSTYKNLQKEIVFVNRLFCLHVKLCLKRIQSTFFLETFYVIRINTIEQTSYGQKFLFQKCTFRYSFAFLMSVIIKNLYSC